MEHKELKKRNRIKLSYKNNGFTMVELIVILVILAVLAAILVPALLGYIDKSKQSRILPNANVAYKAAQSVASENYGLGYKGSNETNYGIFSNGSTTRYCITFYKDGDGKIKSSFDSGLKMGKLAEIPVKYACWVHFVDGEGIRIDGIMYEQDGYAAYFDMTNTRWYLTQNTNTINFYQTGNVDFITTAQKLFQSTGATIPSAKK